MHSTSWFSGGVEYTLITHCRPNEGVDDCLQRHLDDLAAYQEILPED